MRRLWDLAGLVCLVVATAEAQDPVKVAPKNCKVEYEDSQVRVLHWSVGPREKIPMHEHFRGLAISLTDGHTRFTQTDGKARDAQVKAGRVSRVGAEKHMAENLSDKPSESIEIELKTQPPKDRVALRINTTREPGPDFAHWLAQFLAQVRKTMEGTSPGTTPGPEDDPCPGTEWDKYKVNWGEWGGCGKGKIGDNLTDCMASESSGCAGEGCYANACQNCGGSWQTTGQGSGECLEPSLDGFPCCAVLLPSSDRGAGLELLVESMVREALAGPAGKTFGVSSNAKRKSCLRLVPS